MNRFPRTKVRLALLCTALVCVPMAPMRAQAADAASALAQAKLIEDAEGNLLAATSAYDQVLRRADASEAVQDEARLRLANLLLRHRAVDRATAALQPMVDAGGERQQQAMSVLRRAVTFTPQGQAELAATLAERAVALRRQLHDHVRAGRDGAPGDHAKQWDRVVQDLVWLGAPAAAAVVAQLQAVRFLPDNAVLVSGLAEALRCIGTQPAIDCYDAAARDADPSWRLQLLTGDKLQNSARDLLPSLLKFLFAPDPAGLVGQRLFEANLDVADADLEALARETLASPRAFAFLMAERRFGDRGTVATIAPFLGPIRRSLDDLDPTVARAAWILLEHAVNQSQEAALLFIQRLQLTPPGTKMRGIQPAEIDDTLLQAMAEAARALGPSAPEHAQGRGGKWSLACMLQQPNLSFTAASASALLELAELGYCNISPPAVLTRFCAVATPAQMARMVGIVPRVSGNWMQELLNQQDLPSSCRAPLQGLFDHYRETPPPESWGVRGLTAVPNDGTEPQPTWLGRSLVEAIVTSGGDEAMPWLAGILDRQPGFADVVAEWLRFHFHRTPSAATVQAAQVWVSKHAGSADRQAQLPGMLRILAIGGHPATVADTLAVAGPARSDAFRAVIEALLPADAGQQAAVSAHRAAMLQQLLAAAPQDVADAVAAAAKDQPPGAANRRGLSIPPDCLAPLLRLLPRVPEWMQAGRADRYQRDPALLYWIYRPLQQALTADVVANDAEVRREFEALVRADAGWSQLLPEPGPSATRPSWLVQFADTLHAVFPTARYPRNHAAEMLAAGIPLTREEWLRLFGSNDQVAREFAVENLPTVDDPDLLAALLRCASDPHPRVRGAAATALERLLPVPLLIERGVPVLVPLLRDPAPEACDAATAILARLRLYQEQRAFWDRFQAGVQTGPEATVAKLLMQAQAGQPKAQRLLAIDALASTGIIDALPYLIEMTGDSDQEIAAAARGAVGTLRVNVAQRALQPK